MEGADIVVTSKDCRDFLDWLDSHPTHEVNEWEAKFIESNIFRTEFSESQVNIVIKLIKKYPA